MPDTHELRRVAWKTIEEYFAAVTSFGAVADGVTDNATAITLAESELEAGEELYFPPGIYAFKSALTVTRARAKWRGAGHGQTILRYTGSATDIDLITVGDGSTEYGEVRMEGFTIQSSTTMTAGTALRLRKLVRSHIDVHLQGQTGYTTIGNKLWNGVWFNLIDSASFYGEEVYAQNDGILVNGGLGAVGYKADLFVGYAKISRCTVGLRCGGAFGGLYLGNTAFIVNTNNIVIDQTLTAEENREVFISQVISDECTGVGMYVNDAGGTLIQATGTWFASAGSHGVHINSSAGKFIASGCRFFNNTGDGMRVSTAVADILVGSSQFTSNGGYGLNPAVASHRVVWGNCYFAGNTTAAVNYTNAPALQAQAGPLVVEDNSSNQAALVVRGTGANAAGLQLTGDGASTQHKFMRVLGGVLQWLNSAYGAVILQVNDAGALSVYSALYPATPASAAQTASAIYAGTGAPNNADGGNGDFYFRSDGGAATCLYQKRAGAWAATGA